MVKLISLDLNQDIKVLSRVRDFINPDYVFLPMEENCKLLIKNNDKVLKNQPVLYNNDKLVFSPVSGKILGLKKIKDKNKIGNLVVIENDFKEKSYKRILKKSTKIKTREELQILMQENGLMLEIEEKDILTLNAIDNEPYFANNVMYLLNHLQNTLETLDVIKNLYGFNQVAILVKSTESDVLNLLNETIGTYPDFEIVSLPNLYLIGNKEYYKEYIKYNIEDGYEIKLDDLIKISNVIYKNHPISEKYLTITGDGVKKPIVVNAKLCSSLKSIIDETTKLIQKDGLKYYLNGLMTGEEVDITNVIFLENIKGVVITSQDERVSSCCINCGMCENVCPLKLKPKKSLDDNKILNCLSCGLCTYICPSFINFKTITKRGDQNE